MNSCSSYPPFYLCFISYESLLVFVICYKSFAICDSLCFIYYNFITSDIITKIKPYVNLKLLQKYFKFLRYLWELLESPAQQGGVCPLMKHKGRHASHFAWTGMAALCRGKKLPLTYLFYFCLYDTAVAGVNGFLANLLVSP